jgi:exodeoxyribonuclease VII large subunit
MPKEPKVLSVSDLNRFAQNLLEENFSNVWVEGEITNYKGVHSSGHCYFKLKDEKAQIDITAFRGVMGTVRFKLADGLKVLIQGRVSLYPQRGQYQLVASSIEPRGLGALQLAFDQLKKKLAAEGLFSEERKRPIPAFPERIGIVTSPTGAAIQDILSVINRRFASVQILIYPAKVQGEGSKEEIAQGIRYLNENHPELDVLLVGRGGGSIEDLWAFNEEIVARAIAGSQIPVISCVGHEIDYTIADFVADLRAPTPSAAAEIVVKNKKDLRATVDSLFARVQQSLLSTLEHAAERVRGLARSTVFSRPERMFEEKIQVLDGLSENMARALNQSLEQRKASLHLLSSKIRLLSPQTLLSEKEKFLQVLSDKLQATLDRRLQTSREALRASAGQLEALSPLAVLSRGYAIAWASDGTILKSARQASAGDRIRVRLHQGEVRATIHESSIGEKHDEKRNAGTEKR